MRMAAPGIRNRLFGFVAEHYPTERVGDRGAVGALWRVLFYTILPTEPFVMRTAHYRAWVHPKKGNLSRALIRRGNWEPPVTRVFVDRLAPGQLVVDGGANFGHFSLVASKMVGATGRIVAFEPEAKTFAQLQANVALLSIPNVTAERAGLSDVDGMLALTRDAHNPGGHSFIAANVREAGVSEAVPIHRLDTYLAGEPRKLGVLKLDVQGFEQRLITGAAQRIARDRPVIFCEVWPKGMVAAGDNAGTFLQQIQDFGYRLGVIEPGGVRTVNVDEALALSDGPHHDHADFVFDPV
jgi:FkbM family methyltransferase